jgi:probable HAF family extracellular repeat protein
MIQKTSSVSAAVRREMAILLAVGTFMLATGTLRAQEAAFYGLGTLGGSYSYSDHVSADGSTVVGVSQNASGYDEAFIWTVDTGMVGLGTLGERTFSK